MYVYVADMLMSCCMCGHRYQFFLQVKRDVVQGRLPLPYDLATELAAYSVQCKYKLLNTILMGIYCQN